MLPSGNQNAYNIGNIYPSAFFDYLSKLMPKRLKLAFRWLEYLYANSGQVYSVIKKFSEYAITSMVYDTTDQNLRKKLTEIMDTCVRIKSVQIQVGIDYHVYGNSFTSLFTPFTRWLVCGKCSAKYNASNYPYEWMPQAFEFKIKCVKKGCSHHGVATVEHEKLPNPKKLKVIRWDPKQIDISSNPVTGECEYYYNIPDDLKNRIRSKKPDKFLLNTLPWEFIQAIKAKKLFKFREGKLYHMRAPSPAGINSEWGFPGLLGVLKPFFYTAVLRKGNEAIALERIVPWRVMYPQPTTGSNDPAQFMNLARWKNELETAVRQWRRDPNMIKLSPIPVGVTQVGGDARPLMVSQEIQQAEENIVTSMGVPKEFVYGGLTHAGGSVTLRMLENLLFTYIDQLTEMTQWITDQVCDFSGLARSTVRMVDFKLVDDIQQKQLLGQLYQSQEISISTLLKSLDINPEQERKQMIEDQVAKAQMQKEVDVRLKRLQNELADQVEQELSGNPLSYDPQKVMDVAGQEGQILAQMPNDQRKERLAQLQQQDPVLYILAKEALSEMQKQQRDQGAQMMQQQQGGGGGFAITPEASGGGSSSTPMAGK